MLREENNGLQNITAALTPLPEKFGVSPGDVLQVGAPAFAFRPRRPLNARSSRACSA